jgi:hypothetical protein
MKEHNVFSEFDFSMKMRDRFKYGSAPFIPTEAEFNEKAERDSE